MPEQFDQLKRPTDARKAHRRAQAVRAELLALQAELDHASVEQLQTLAADRPTEVAAQLESAGPRAEEARKRANEMRELAGLSDADYPWSDWVRPSTPERPSSVEGGSFRDQLGVWEELAVQREDEAEHPAAYDKDPAVAKFASATAEARVVALRDMIARVDGLAAANEPKPNRAGRRAAGERGPKAPDAPPEG